MKTRASALLGNFQGDTEGVAAVEFALLAMLLITAALNAFDIGRFAYQRMQVENASYDGAQAAWKTCNDPITMLPATQNCSGLSAAVTTAVQSTSLGSAVALPSSGLVEGYYCVNATNSLQAVGTLTSKPANCAAAGNASATPGDYLQVTVTFTYAPMFPGITVMGTRGTSAITRTSWMRLG